MNDDDIKAIRDALPGKGMYQTQEFLAACHPERIARLLDALEQARSNLAAERERTTQLGAKLQDARDFLQELQEQDSE